VRAPPKVASDDVNPSRTEFSNLCGYLHNPLESWRALRGGLGPDGSAVKYHVYGNAKRILSASRHSWGSGCRDCSYHSRTFEAGVRSDKDYPRTRYEVFICISATVAQLIKRRAPTGVLSLQSSPVYQSRAVFWPCEEEGVGICVLRPACSSYSALPLPAKYQT
jgi:hypothetical protein